MKNIIIHFPFQINRKRKAASQLRPLKIISTFESMGYHVDLIEGYGKERKAAIKEVKRKISSGVKYDFLYSECSTIPTLLTEKNHLPTHPFIDFSFFRFCKRQNIKIGLFYRDIYWCFPENKKGWKSKVAYYFYKYDLYMYKKYLSAIFVPSFEMMEYVPYNLNLPVFELYPGCDIKQEENNNAKSDGLNILYVGGVGDHYDLHMCLNVIKQNPRIKFTLCCRKDDWETAKSSYKDCISDNVEVVHQSGAELEPLYQEADLFCLFVEPGEYRKFAVPFKLFETIGYGCPILSSKGTWVAKFVEESKIGYVCEYKEDDLKDLLDRLSQNRQEIAQIKDNIKNIAEMHTWKARCNKIAQTLQNEKD